MVMPRSLIAYALTILQLISLLIGTQADYEPWNNYVNAIGLTLTNTFKHPHTLEEALKKHIQVTQSLHDVMVYDCYSYIGGAEQARLAREGSIPNATLIPFLVDEQNNRMCFLRISKPNERDESKHSIRFTSTDFRLPILYPLKLDSSMYESLNNKNQFTKPDTKLVVSFRQEVFDFDQYEEHEDISINAFEQHLQNTANNRESSPFESFFWTSHSAGKYFQEHQEEREIDRNSFLADYSRYKLILEALNPLRDGNDRGNKDHGKSYAYQSMNAQHLENEYYQENLAQDDSTIWNRCQFAHLFHNDTINYSPGSIQFRIDSIASEEVTDTRYACFLALAIALSSMNSTHHIAIQASPQLLNFRARSIPQSATVSNQLSNQPYTKAGLLGDGQIVTIADTGVDVASCYFYDPAGRVTPSSPNAPVINNSFRKIIGYIYNSCGDPTDTSGGHGTHVAGTVAGSIPKADLTAAGQYAGVAPNAKIIFNDFSRGGSGLCIPGSQQLYGIGFSGGARIHTNSWGSPFSGNGYYSTADTDNYLRNNPGMTVFFAAGNFGGNGMGTSTITMESSAKNVISVASGQTTLGSSNISYIAWYSSKGPPYDGRFKPDIVAPGDGLLSAMASGSTNSQTCKTIEMTGTSMASPAAAGSAALIRQYFTDNTGKFWTGICKTSYRSCRAFTPTGYLVKAIIIHSGMQMTLFNGGGEYDIQLKRPPDYMQGFGRIGLHTVLPLKGVITSFDLFIADAVNVAENSMVGYIVDIGTSNKPLSATIAWYDPPNVQGTTTKALINDINLQITSPSGQKFFPNGRTFPDSNNNVEKIVIPSAAAGKWKVTVSANALPVTGNQLFALVITSAGTFNAGETKKKMEILSEKLRPSYPGYKEEVDRLAHACQTSGPYTHSVLDPLCDTSFLAKVHGELTTNMKANFKETDLFKVFQTAELGAISEDSLRENMPHFLQLRNIIYSQEFRNMIQRITGCTELIDRVDCSANAYANSCHLLCHDDVIGTRCVSYIIYLSDPDEPWTIEEGGAVELYPLDESSIVDPTNTHNLQGVPIANPTKSILPTFNSMLFFTVQPGRSYHSVQEVFSKHRPRLSISGWYHAAQPPVGSDMSSLQQILSKGDKVDNYMPIPYAVTPTESIEEFPKGTIYGLTKEDIRGLSQWLSSDYLSKKAIDQIRDQFIEDSSVQLHNFLSPTISEEIMHKIIAADYENKLGKGRPSLDYTTGLTSQWSVIGPPHKKRYLQFSPASTDASLEVPADVAGKLMQSVGEFLHSELFAKYISAITTVIVLTFQQEIRRFRPGFDYTVAHYSLLTKEKHLDATLCFVNDDNDVEKRILEELVNEFTGNAKKNNKRKADTDKKKKGKKSTSSGKKGEEEEEDEEAIVEAENDEEDYAIQWDDGDVGGFECFIEADDDAEAAEAAEVYRQEKDEEEEDAKEEEEENKDMTTSDKTKNRKAQTTLLSVSAHTNSLSLVLRDEGIMKFVKYVSANAPGSRWDIATEYKILDTGDDDDDDEDRSDAASEVEEDN